jgi:[ribosomal protein S5]-alanine N-acetyltransferase
MSQTEESQAAAHQGPTIFELPGGITVRRYRTSDAASCSRHANNKKIWDNLRNRMPHPYTQEDAASWIQFANDPNNFVRTGPWAEATGADGPAIPAHYAIAVNDEAIGSIALEFCSDIYFRSAEVGYWLGEDFWGKGVMSKVVPAFVDWSWKTFGILIRLNGSTAEWNQASGKLLQKAGFEYEGRRKHATVKNGKVGNELMWGALRPE